MLDVFRDRLELVGETCTQAVFVCPVCGTKHLKINKHSGAYCCFGSGCASGEIRRALGMVCKSHLQSNPQIIFPVEVSPQNIIFPELKLKRPPIQVFEYKKYNSKASKVIYQYTENLRMVRVKIWNTNEKFFFPEVLENGQWVSSRGKQVHFPFYNSLYLESNRDKTLLVTEGEKCAAQLSQDFALTMSPVGYGSNSQKYLAQEIYQLKFQVRNVLYISDGDTIGQHKAMIFQKLCWQNNLPCSVLNLGFQNKEDIYDWLVEEKRTSTEIQSFLLGGLNGV